MRALGVSGPGSSLRSGIVPHIHHADRFLAGEDVEGAFYDGGGGSQFPRVIARPVVGDYDSEAFFTVPACDQSMRSGITGGS